MAKVKYTKTKPKKKPAKKKMPRLTGQLGKTQRAIEARRKRLKNI